MKHKQCAVADWQSYIIIQICQDIISYNIVQEHPVIYTELKYIGYKIQEQHRKD